MPKSFDGSVGRWLRARNYRATAAGSSERDESGGPRAALVAPLLVFASGLMTLIVVAILRPTFQLTPLLLDVGAAVLLGGLIPIVPWGHMPPGAKSLLGPLGLIFLGIGEIQAPGLVPYIAPLFIVDFVFMGLFEPPGYQVLVAPLGLAASLAPLLFDGVGLKRVLPGVAALAMGVVTAEVVAWVSATERTNTQRLRAIVTMARNLAASDSFVEGIDKALDGLLGLVNAEYAILVLWDQRNGRPGDLFIRGSGGAAGNGAMIAIARRALVLSHRANLSKQLPKAKVISVTESKPFYAGWRPVSAGIITPNVTKNTPFGDSSDPKKFALEVPLFGAEQLLGVLLVEANGENELETKSQLTVLQATSADLSALLQRQLRTDRLVSEATTDPLSGLSNRRSFFTKLQDIDRGDSVAFVDLDFFKQLNDTLGHHEGDIEISRFSVILASNLRGGDLASRYGGDEFAIVFKGANEEQVQTVLERVRRSWATMGRTTFSAGVAQYHSIERPIDILRRADLAVYAAKRRGRNRTVTSQSLTKAEQAATTGGNRMELYEESEQSGNRA